MTQDPNDEAVVGKKQIEYAAKRRAYIASLTAPCGLCYETGGKHHKNCQLAHTQEKVDGKS
jgi:hypothetical protein